MNRPIPLYFEMYPAERRATLIGGRYTQADHKAATLDIIGDDDKPAAIAISEAANPALWGLLAAANFQIAQFLTITAAQYGNADHSAALVDTDEAGRKAISAEDNPELWRQLQEWTADGNTIFDYVAPKPPAKRVFTMNEFLGRMTDVQQKALITLGTTGPVEAKVWYAKFIGAQSISIDDPRTAEGLAFLVANTGGVFTDADKAALLSPV